MNKNTIFIILTLVSLLLTADLFSVPLTGSYNVGTGQTYTSLTKPGGFFAAVNANGLSGNVTVLITSDLAEDGVNSLNQWTETGAGNYTITISPSAASLRTITTGNSANLLNFMGSDRVTIDGRFAGSGKYLLFRNTSTSNAVLNFQNDARRNTITYCSLESNNASALGVSATVIFNTTTGAKGNDSNTISFCDIRECTNGSGAPLNAILCFGTTTTNDKYNDWNIITGCNIINTFNNANSFVDIYAGDGNANMTISNNSFYQTAVRNASASAAYFCMIMATTGNNNTVSGNYVGGTAPLCAGSPMVISSGAGLFGFRIFQVGATTTTTIQNNVVSNIDFTLTASGDYFFFKGIEVNVSGKVDLIGNTIGSMSGVSSIILRYGGLSGNPYPSALNFGYYWSGNSTVTGNVTNNNVGGISLTGVGFTAGNVTFTGIIAGFDRTLYNGTVNISGNTIGNNIASNFQNIMNVRISFYGINTNVSSPGSATVTNNTVRNLTDASTNANCVLKGIYHDGSANFTATGNTVTELNTAALNIGGMTGGSISNAVTGISTGVNSTGVVTITSNIINGMRSTTAGATNTVVKGMAILGNGTGNITRNKVYDLTNASTGTGPGIFGMYNYFGSMTAANNQIDITNGEASDRPLVQAPIPGTNPPVDYSKASLNLNNNNSPMTSVKSTLKTDVQPVQDKASYYEYNGDNPVSGTVIQGIHDESSGAWNYYYNTVYVGGSTTTQNNITSCFTKDFLASTLTLRNNLFYNGRTGNGTHFAINNNIAGVTLSSNYNAFVSSNAANIGRWLGSSSTITQWRTSSSNDKQTWSTTSGALIATNLFNSVLTGDLRINSSNSAAWLVSGKGIALATINVDYEGTARSTTISGGCTDVGADEFVATPPANPNVPVDFAPGSGVTSTYTLWGRTIAVINWGAGGSSYPTSVNIQYYSGINPPSVVGGNYSNSYWVVTPTGTLTGAAYDINFTFGDNETYTITSPSANTRLAKYNPSSWEVFSALGTGVYQTDLVWANLTVKSRGMYNFSTYALTDVGSPLPVSMLYFNAAAEQRSVKLNWSTAWEINNKGFDIERRNHGPNSTFSTWQKVGYVDGNGTTNNETHYSATDDKLTSGTYQYRLKQTDFNGNFEYFDLNTPTDVVVGTPKAFDVYQNYPNPSNPNTKIDYQIPFSGKISLKVYDISGREVATLEDGIKEAGYYTSDFNGANLASGVYFYRLIANSNDGQKFSKTMKMILVK